MFYFSANSIRPEPSFVGSSLKNITVPEGRDVVLSCTVKNLDGHKVAWIHYDRSAILTVDKTVITRNARIGVSHEGKKRFRKDYFHFRFRRKLKFCINFFVKPIQKLFLKNICNFRFRN